jgi:predicted porin
MKKQFALGLLAAVAATGAFAQSSVTVYGRLNVTVESIKIGEDGDRQGDVHNNSSRIGFKGVEDLGSGLKAGFQIEHGFDPTTGAQSQSAFWARQSEVWVGGNFGKVRLGTFTSEAYYATADYISMHNHDTGDSSDALYAYVGNNSNKVGYASPDINGLTFHASVAEGAGAIPGPEQGKSGEVAVNYDKGPLHLGAGYGKKAEQKALTIRGLYEFGPFVVGAYVQRDTDGYGNNLGDRTSFRLSGMYAMGASEFHVNVGRAGDYDNLDDSSATQWTLGYNYNLSKRTKVYGYYTRISAGDAVTFGGGQVYGGDYDAFALGIRHNF